MNYSPLSNDCYYQEPVGLSLCAPVFYCMCMPCMPDAHGGKKRVPDPLEPNIHHVSAWNQSRSSARATNALTTEKSL